MTRAALRFWGWVWASLLVVVFARAAWADEELFEPIHVCVRPPDVPKDVKVWSYWAGSRTITRLHRGEFVELKTRDAYTFAFDPDAPPENTKKLPPPYRDLPCDPKPPPPPPPEPEKTSPKKEVPKQEGSGAGGTGGQDQQSKSKQETPSAPRAQFDDRGPRAPEEEQRHHPRWPEGVTKDWPHSVLPTREAEPKRSVLPTKRRDDRCAWALPWPEQKAVGPAQVCRGKGEGDKPGVEKTWGDKIAENLAYGSGLVNLQLDEDLKRPDGKQYGVMGGRNPEGPNNPFMQAAASGVMIAAAVLSPKAEKLYKRLTSAKKAAPLLMKEMEDVGLGVADEIAAKRAQVLTKTGDELLTRAYLADALEQNGAIGPYEVMQQFTDQLGGRWQAHHILEVQMVERFELGNAAQMPSVILTETEHKVMTAKLANIAKRSKSRILKPCGPLTRKPTSIILHGSQRSRNTSSCINNLEQEESRDRYEDRGLCRIRHLSTSGRRAIRTWTGGLWPRCRRGR